MEDSDRDADELFPVVGERLEPTAEDIAAGRFGNGSWDLTNDSLEKRYMEVHQQKKADQDERRNFFHERAKDALADAVKLHHAIIRRGNDVMARIEAGEDVSKQDLTILSMAQKSSKELVDRANGRAGTAAREESTTTSILQLIERNDNG